MYPHPCMGKSTSLHFSNMFPSSVSCCSLRCFPHISFQSFASNTSIPQVFLYSSVRTPLSLHSLMVGWLIFSTLVSHDRILLALFQSQSYESFQVSLCPFSCVVTQQLSSLDIICSPCLHPSSSVSLIFCSSVCFSEYLVCVLLRCHYMLYYNA